MRKQLFVLFLFAFWVLLSGQFSPLLLGLGALSVLLVAGLMFRMNRIDRQPSTVQPSAGIFAYAAWLAGRVIRANFDVARRIWDPELPVRPVWERLDTQVETPVEKPLYANSITLTPGTLTTDVGEDHFRVHCLSRSGRAELERGEMERRIRRLGV